MAQRISRAKQRVRDAGSRFALPPEPERAERLRVVLHVLYLIFNEGYTASAGQRLHRGELTREAIRLTRTLHRLLPDDGEVAGLLALMLLTEARRPARTGPTARSCPSPSRTGAGGTTASSPRASRSSATPCRGPGSVRTNCRRRSPRSTTRRPRSTRRTGPRCSRSTSCSSGCRRARWSRSTALSRWRWSAGRRPGSTCWRTLEADDRMARHHRLHAVRAHLLERAGDTAAARDSYRTAARLATNVPERRYLDAKAASLTP